MFVFKFATFLRTWDVGNEEITSVFLRISAVANGNIQPAGNTRSSIRGWENKQWL